MNDQYADVMGEETPMMGAEDSATGGFTILVRVSGDGALTVAVEGQEGAEMQPGQPPAEGQPAENIKEALTMALAAYKNNGQLPDIKGQSDEFAKGFASGPQQAPKI